MLLFLQKGIFFSILYICNRDAVERCLIFLGVLFMRHNQAVKMLKKIQTNKRNLTTEKKSFSKVKKNKTKKIAHTHANQKAPRQK